jgi:hypothetical protein
MPMAQEAHGWIELAEIRPKPVFIWLGEPGKGLKTPPELKGGVGGLNSLSSDRT